MITLSYTSTTDIDLSLIHISCTCNGLELRQDGKEYPIDEIIEYMNEYLDKKWMRVRKSKDNEHMLNV